MVCCRLTQKILLLGSKIIVYLNIYHTITIQIETSLLKNCTTLLFLKKCLHCYSNEYIVIYTTTSSQDLLSVVLFSLPSKIPRKIFFSVFSPVTLVTLSSSKLSVSYLNLLWNHCFLPFNRKRAYLAMEDNFFFFFFFVN